MKRPEATITLKKWMAPVLLLAVVLVCAVTISGLLMRMDSTIEDNGKISMQAVVEQVQQTYELQVQNYYSRLRMVGAYVSRDGDPFASADFTFLINALQKETSSQVLFMKDNGMAMTADKEESKLDISSTLLLALKNNQNIAKLVTYDDGGTTKSAFLLAIPCQEYQLNGDTFTAVGLLVDRSEIDTVLKLYAYGGAAYLFMLDADGDVVYTNQTDEKLFQNYSLLKHLNKDGALTEGQAESLYQSFQDRGTGVELLGGDRAYYLGYCPIQNSNSTLVCLVPRGTVDNTLMSYQQTVLYTTLAMAAVMILLLAGLFFSFSKISLANQRASFEKRNLRQQQENVKALEALNAELKEAQEVTVQALQSAEAANQAKTDFLANMSHDIRTPLNAIIGISTLIEHDPGNEQKVVEYVRRIGVSSQNLLSIINEVLDMNKIESGKTTLDCVDFCLFDLIGNVEDIFRPQTEARHQTFQVVTENIQHEWLNGDSVRLMQVLGNLLSNAVKYTQEGGKIQLLIEERPANASPYARLCISVKDNGIGMEKDFQEKIFDAFTREESTLTNKIQGTGLGMAIARNLVELMGGTISVESEKGEGTCFEIVLDLKIAQQLGSSREPQKQDASHDAVTLQGMRFLCAEDNALNAEILTELLRMEGAECVICENGKAVLRAFEASKPGDFDMILMDVQMPVMNGYDAARAIRNSSNEQARTMPIIAMTANAFSEDIQASFAAGMNAHVSKPVDMNVLKRTIGNLRSGRGGGTEPPFDGWVLENPAPPLS